MPDVTPGLIFQVANGFMAAKHLFVANQVGLFEALGASPATLDDLAHRTGIPRRTLRILADAMVALGFLERQGDQYQNTPVASTFLSGHTPTDLHPALRYWNQLNYQRFCKKQQIQWSKRGAHLLLQTRVKTLNGELGSMFKRWYPDMQVGELAEAASSPAFPCSPLNLMECGRDTRAHGERRSVCHMISSSSGRGPQGVS